MSDTKANNMQVGGTHYKTTYEHWDLVLDAALGYLEGCATKYVTRWRHKDGAKDLKKALHYVNKMLEAVAVTPNAWPKRLFDGGELSRKLMRYTQANELHEIEEQIIARLAVGPQGDVVQQQAQLREVRDMVLFLIDVAEQPVVHTARSDSNKSDSNKHAFQEGEGGEVQS